MFDISSIIKCAPATYLNHGLIGFTEYVVDYSSIINKSNANILGIFSRKKNPEKNKNQNGKCTKKIKTKTGTKTSMYKRFFEKKKNSKYLTKIIIYLF